ncbi:MAG: hypothetical protein Ct9H300mP31_00730 [Acidimicrobiaceae bacterium]|nr:MAG: hypothetical protein Ct9H300mP31_00730 [Acidimicrobiaceae bacterium]
MVDVRLRGGIPDPAGATIERALPALGYEGVTEVSVGKTVRFTIEAADPRRGRPPGPRTSAPLSKPKPPVIEDASVIVGGPRADGHHGGCRDLPRHQLRDGCRVIRGSGWGALAACFWHADEYLGNVDAVIFPGAGSPTAITFPPGAIPRFSPVMGAVARFAADGGPVVGICNGFQVLTESGLLPGALQKNAGLKFLCQPTTLRVETTGSVLPRRAEVGDELSVPINHFEGNYTCDAETLARVRDEDRVVLRYLDNPNGSVDDIAGGLQRGPQCGWADAPSGAGARDDFLGADGAVLWGLCWIPPDRPTLVVRG